MPVKPHMTSPKLFIAWTVITAKLSSCLVHTLWITQNNACSWALSRVGVHSMSIVVVMWQGVFLFYLLRCTVPKKILMAANSFSVQRLIVNSYVRPWRYRSYGMIMGWLVKSRSVFLLHTGICSLNNLGLAIYNPVSTCIYSCSDGSGHPAPADKRRFQRSHHILG